ncbi:uncharacterized protein LOC106663201 [Cimex lectularius]|uniref:Uncharacterized protein n=1 Tax=Cimex lectularius TaxID=79782 RepID=A0A8I6REL5_CIMLE|nr:uncharacterized protein LOC106663201 [Cimex lectularius]
MWVMVTPLRQGLRRGMGTAGKFSKNGCDNCPAQAKRNQEMKEKINQYTPPLGNFIPARKTVSSIPSFGVARNGISVCPVQLQRVVQTQDNIQKKLGGMNEKKK